MAFYAEMVRIGWYCVKSLQMIHWYKQKLYDDWWDSLTEEEKEIVEENRRKRKERRDKELHDALMRLGMIAAVSTSFYSGANMGISNRDKYHGVYDEFGFPNL